MYINVQTAAERLRFHSKQTLREQGHDKVMTDPSYFLPFIRHLRLWEFCHFSFLLHIQLQRCGVIKQNWNEPLQAQPQTGDREREPWGAATMGLKEKKRKSACTPLPPPSVHTLPMWNIWCMYCCPHLSITSRGGENDLTMLSNFAYNWGCYKRDAKASWSSKCPQRLKSFESM